VTARLLEARALVRRHQDRAVVDDVSLAMDRGEVVVLTGPSGCGKTSLLHMLGLLDPPTAGQVFIEGRDGWALSSHERAAMRLGRIGFVFQQSNLLPHLTARENVALPAWRLGGQRDRALERAQELLERFGLAGRADAAGGVLSLGEAQRVAVARAIVNRPAIVLADEPTGSLDTVSGAAVLAALEELCAEGTMLLVATHDPRVAERWPRRFAMRDGRFVDARPAVTSSS
jgi:ABC-type lipoprotein export system ATPase subunit